MPETTTPTTPEVTATQTATPPVAPPKPPAPKQNGRKGHAKKIRNRILGVITLALVIVGGYFLFQFLTAQDEIDSQLFPGAATIGTIESRAQGNGMARAKETAAITLSQGGTVQKVFVQSGDIVTVGQPLYTISSPEAEEVADLAKQKLADLSADLTDLIEKRNNLTIRAPFSGKLVEVSDLNVDDKLAEGSAVATLANDKQLKLSLYFSYAYENDIHVGQTVSVSIPTVMNTYDGTVDEINKVSYISPEGAVHFEVVIMFENPGTLTAEMDASAFITADDDTFIFPYENSKLEYSEVREITCEVAGPILSENLLRYGNVKAGDALVTLGSDTIDTDIRAKQTEVDAAAETYTESQKALGNFNAVAPIDGRITSASPLLVEGGEIKAGETVIVISNTTNMLVDITVDDRNISFVKPNMTVELSDWNGNTFMGIVSAIDTGNAESNNGMTSYPVSLSVENASGALMDGAWLDYSFVASQSNDCVLVPMQSVRYVSDENGETNSVIFIKSDVKPENIVELDIPPVGPGETPTYPSQEDGYYPVPVTTGLSDNYNVEITSGLVGGEELFISYIVENSWG